MARLKASRQKKRLSMAEKVKIVKRSAEKVIFVDSIFELFIRSD